MGLLSIFKRDRADVSVPSAATQTVQQARTLARRRLIGATLLVLMGIVGFPLLFESQPRPIPVDIPIDIPRSGSATSLAIPPVRSQAILVEPAVPASPATKSSSAEPPIRRDEAANPAIATANAASTAKLPASARTDAALTDKEKLPDKAPTRLAAATSTLPIKPAAPSEPSASATSSAGNAARAQALLEGRESKVAPNTVVASSRFVVQVGAFADAAAAKEVRQKVDKLGLKTYTQVVDTPSGSRTRVRVGPLESKEQADKALERLKAAGLSAVVLTL